MTVPNLDCEISTNSLWRFWRNSSSRQFARELFPDRPKGYCTVTRDLGHYACNKAVAMDRRLNGEIDAALIYESICDRIYIDLPHWAKW